MTGAHARFEFKPLPVAAQPPTSLPALEPLSPLSDLSPSPPLSTPVHPAPRTRLASGSGARPSQRRRDAAGQAVPPLTPAAPPVRRIRPLACMSSNTNGNTLILAPGAQNQGKDRWKEDGWKVGATQPQQTAVQPQQILDFPPKHVVLHPDDANNRVFLAIGRALMSVNNRAMTIKDLADMSMHHGMVCQNASASSQAITFYIRAHLHRCEEEQDFPLLLRHVLSGSTKDDALAPALYSRTGGNVSVKEKMAKDENGNLRERPTCFRRGTTVWYLSRAAGAPCPFARVGIALRDYAECSSITSVESRRADGDSRGKKRKRERSLRKRAGSGPAARCDDNDSELEERKPSKIKITLRIPPSSTTLREKAEVEEEESSSSSDSELDSVQDEPMEVDASGRMAPSPSREPAASKQPTWSFPPFPIQRRISIPPYTPSEETYPTIYTSPTTNHSACNFFSEWPAPMKPKLELACVDSPPGPNTPGLGSYYHRDRAPSVPFSIASPPPESDDEFGLGDDEDDDLSVSMSPEMRFKREDELAYVWPQAAPTSPSFDVAHVKSEPDYDDAFGAGSSKRSSTQTVKQVKFEEVDLDIGSLELSFGEYDVGQPLSFGLGVDIKQEDGTLVHSHDGFSWGQPVDLTYDDPLYDVAASEIKPTDDAALKKLWEDVELLGPDSVRLQDLDDGSWEDGRSRQDVLASPPRSHTRTPLEQHDEAVQRGVTPQSPDFGSMSPAFTYDSLPSLPSLAGSVRSWSACSPETESESVGPASPPSFVDSESPAVVRGEELSIDRSSPWQIPGKSSVPSFPSRQAIAVRSDDIPGITLSEQSAPWERGMCTEEDVEKHLLAPAPPLAMMGLDLSASTKAPLETTAAAIELPLSPQEEAVFQSLCICPDMSWGSEPELSSEPTVTKEVAKPIEVNTPRLHETAFSGVLAAATRPTMRLRERRPSKRLSELEQARRQADKPRAETPVKAPSASTESDSDAEFEAELTPRPREKRPTTTVDNNSKEPKGPLRRSKRVATNTATQRNRERLRKR